FRAAVERRELRVTAAFEGLRVARVSEDELLEVDPDLGSFRNANWPAKASAIEAELRARTL
ncbi:MAG: molybdopterin-guanine dinucleotide biosynthesis protein B, partial [Tepidiformaceae bacterium]